jgi:hypothetical protein
VLSRQTYRENDGEINTLPAKDISLLPSSSSDSRTDFGIDEFMPPGTQETSEKFLDMLTDLATSGRFEELEGLEMLLIPSIISALKFIPNIEQWKSAVSVLCWKFSDVFEDQICTFIVSFGCNPWLLKLALKIYSFDSLIGKSMEMPEEHALVFFVGLINLGELRLPLASNVLNFVRGLINRFADTEECDVIKAFLDTGDRQFLVLIQSVRNADESTFVSCVEPVLAKLREEPSQIPVLFERLEKVIAKIVVRPLRDMKANVLKFFRSVIRDCRVNNYGYILPSIAAFLIDQDHAIANDAAVLLGQMLDMGDQSFRIGVMEKTRALLRVEMEKGSALLGILDDFFQRLDSAEIGKYAEAVMKFLSPDFASKVLTVRRIVRSILSELRFKIPQEFQQYMGKLTIEQQYLIERNVPRKVKGKDAGIVLQSSMMLEQ